MAAPLNLAASTDLTEYSRFEVDRNTVVVTVVPGVPIGSLSAAVSLGGTLLTLSPGFTLPSTGFPYSVLVGSGSSQETVTASALVGNQLTVSALAMGHSPGAPVQQVVSLAGEQITVQIVKGRRQRDVEVATKTLTLTGIGAATISFFLPDIVDASAASRVRRGTYFVRVTSVTSPSITAVTPDFLISFISVDFFKSEYLHGADRRAMDTLSVKNQPMLVTGVTVTEVSRGHQQGWIVLSFNYSDPGNGLPVVRTLSWCDGPLIPIRQGQQNYTLRKGTHPSDFIDVQIPAIIALPTQSIAEELLIEPDLLDDNKLRNMIDEAISWVEDTALTVFLEPTRVVTEVDPTQITYAAGSDIPEFVNADWDRRVDAVTFMRPAAGHWMNWRMPYYPIIRFNTLYGKVSNVRILDVALEWVEVHEKGGFVELVPFNQEVAFNFIGLIWVETLRGPVPIPNFWNFDALVGYRQTPPVLRELVGKKAAIDALIKIGQSFRPGLSSQSVSRDGISESVTYLTSAQYGIFHATINSYQEWIDKNLPLLKGAFRGVNMVVV